jgi:dihydrofolate reductase
MACSCELFRGTVGWVVAHMLPRRPSTAEGSTSKHASVVEALSSLPDRYDRPSSSPTSDRANRIFLIGGSQIYTQCLDQPPTSHPLVDRILLTRILSPAYDECDVFLPDFSAQDGEGKQWRRTGHKELVDWVGWDVPEGVVQEKGVEYRYEMWVRS